MTKKEQNQPLEQLFLYYSSGLSQKGRDNPALAADFVSLDNRGSLDIIRQCQQLASCMGLGAFLPADLQQQKTLVDYINQIQHTIDQWQQTDVQQTEASQTKARQAETPTQSHTNLLSRENALAVQPHMQLFLSFLQLLKHPQQQFSQLMFRQANFYYQDVLKFQHQKAVPDSVFLTFALDSKATTCQLPAGCQLFADADPSLPAQRYQLDEDLLVTQAHISQVRYLAKQQHLVNVLSKNPTADGHAPFYLDLSCDSDDLLPAKAQPTDAQFGVIETYSTEDCFLQSDLLWLKEGQRTIILTFNKAIVDLEKVALSTASGWQELDESCLQDADKTLTLILDASFPPIEPLPDTHLFRLPAIKLVPAAGEQLNINKLELCVAVDGLKALALANQNGESDNHNSIELFGYEPEPGACFSFTNPELCHKPLNQLTLNLDWVPGAVPNKDGYPNIDKIYQSYPRPINENKTIGEDCSNSYLETFKVQLQLATENGQVLPVADEENLFSELDFAIDANSLLSKTTYSIPAAWQLKFAEGNFLYQQYFIAQNQQTFNASQSIANTFLLTSYTHEMTALLERQKDDANNESLNNAIETLQAKIDALEEQMSQPTNATEPVYPPYTPAVRPISVDYKTAKQTVQAEYMDEIGSLGCRSGLFPAKEHQNALLFKVAGADNSQQLTLLCSLASFWSVSGNAARSISNAMNEPSGEVNWFYYVPSTYTSSSWHKITPEVTARNPLQDRMILRFSFPADVAADPLWLKVHIGGSNIASHVQQIYVQTQAALATRIFKPEAENQGVPVNLPPAMVQHFVEQQPAIQSIHQPFASFSGKAKESDTQRQIRASERLSHRQRAVTARDYENLVLANFPQIKKIWCLTATQLHQMNSQSQTGEAIADNTEFDPNSLNLQVMVDRELSERGAIVYYPMAEHALLQEVTEFLMLYSSPFVNICVTNPFYRALTLQIDAFAGAEMNLQSEYEHQKIQQRIESRMMQHLSTQLLDEDRLPRLGQPLELHKLQQQLYRLDNVTNVSFKLTHQQGVETEITGFIPIGMTLIPASQHSINLKPERPA